MQSISIYQRRDGHFEGRAYLGKAETGKRKYKSYYGTNEREVVEKYSYEKAALEPCLTKMTVREIVLEWLNAALGRIKKSTAANYRMKAEKHIIPAFGGMDFGMIRSKEIYTFINNKLSDGLSARYVSDMVVLIKSVMKFAEREYGINNTIKSVSVTKKIRPEVRLLSETEQVILKHHISTTLRTRIIFRQWRLSFTSASISISRRRTFLTLKTRTPKN